MRKIIYLFVFLSVFLSSCAKKQEVEYGDNEYSQDSINIPTVQNLQESNIAMYVNSPEGLRVRNSPNMNGDRIAVLDDLTVVNVIMQNEENINIDGINGKWTYIESEDIRGWVFGGYLSSLKPLRTIIDIVKYIRSDLDLHFRYTNLGDLFLTLKLNDDDLVKGYEILEQTTRQHPDSLDGFWYYYIIGIGPYKLGITSWAGPLKDNFQRDGTNFSLGNIEIDINKNNYLELFPYRTIDEYVKINDFGKTVKIEDNYIQYQTSHPMDAYEYCNLVFDNGFLKSIELYFYQG